MSPTEVGSSAPAPEVDQPHGNAAAAEQIGAPPPVDGGTLAQVAADVDRPAPDPDDPASHAAALAFNAQAHAWADDIIGANKDRPVEGDPKSRPNILRNTTQWIAGGQAILRILTPTHDSHLREGISEREVATFERQRVWPSGGGSYRAADDGVDDRTGITVERRSAQGGMDAKGVDLTVILPTSRHELEETLIHEVQHDADQHGGEDNEHDHFAEDADKAQPDVDPWVAGDWVYTKWKTEFRSYWLNDSDKLGSATERPYPVLTRATYDGRTATATTSFANKRQTDIFAYMRSVTGPKEARNAGRWLDARHEWIGPYASIFHYYAFDPAFRAVVDATEAPVGGNLINSVRIQSLSEALAHGDFDRVLAAARALDAADRGFLTNRKESAPFWTQVARTLKRFDDIDALATIIDSPDGASAAAEHLRASLTTSVVAGAATKPTTHTVVRGDTLGGIAAKHLGDASRWPEIHELNRDRVRDPKVLRRGTVLRLPPS